jgi:hypothetical protein
MDGTRRSSPHGKEKTWYRGFQSLPFEESNSFVSGSRIFFFWVLINCITINDRSQNSSPWMLQKKFWLVIETPWQFGFQLQRWSDDDACRLLKNVRTNPNSNLNSHLLKNLSRIPNSVLTHSLTHSSYVEESEQKKSKILLSLIQPLLKNLSTNPNSNLTHAQTQIPTFHTHHDLFKNPRIRAENQILISHLFIICSRIWAEEIQISNLTYSTQHWMKSANNCSQFLCQICLNPWGKIVEKFGY